MSQSLVINICMLGFICLFCIALHIIWIIIEDKI